MNLENFQLWSYTLGVKVCLNGKFVSEAKAKVSVFDGGFTSGYGIYETLLVDGGTAMDVKAHVDRLFGSAKKVGLRLPWSRSQIAQWTSKIAQQTNKSMRLRITISFEPTLVIFAVPLVLPKSKKGYKVITYNIERILPEVKTTCLLPQYLARREMVRKKADEVLLVNHKGQITEGSITNVFFVKNGRLVTPKDGILKGTMRQRVIKIAKRLKVPVSERVCKKSEKFQECFVTNSLRFLVPVTSIDGRKLQDGPITKLIQDEIEKG